MTIYFAPLGAENASEAVRRLLARAWTDWRGVEPQPPLIRLPGGKPDFAHTAHCSLTHSKTMVAVALCETPVGLDAETLRAVSARLYRRVLAPEEQRWLEGAENRDAAFLRLWTLKEAYLKYTGEGLRRWPNGLCFSPDGEYASLRGKPELCFGSAERADCVLSWCVSGSRQEVFYKCVSDL